MTTEPLLKINNEADIPDVVEAIAKPMRFTAS